MNIEEYINLCLLLNLNLVDGKSGNMSLSSHEYVKGSKLAIIPNNAQSILFGHTFKEVILKESFYLYDLMFENQRVMTNAPLEMYKLFLPFLKSKGNILIGGYGMGVLTRLICEKTEVNKVVAFENNPDILKLCQFGYSVQKVCLK